MHASTGPIVDIKTTDFIRVCTEGFSSLLGHLCFLYEQEKAPVAVGSNRVRLLLESHLRQTSTSAGFYDRLLLVEYGVA